MNYGAFIYKKNLFKDSELKEIESLVDHARTLNKPLHASGNYAGIGWNRYGLNVSLPYVKKILQAIGTDEASLIDFYFLDPGATLHPHRDLTGASLNNRIRFHVPVVTNSKVLFEINGQKNIFMKSGDLWCLDTSYTHSVHNGGDKTRVHIVVECDINSRIRLNIPNDIKSKIHSAAFFFYLVWAFIKSLVNVVKDPKYLLVQFGMIKKFIKWRILKIGKPK